MSDKNVNSSSLAMNALSDIPTPSENAQEITALVKESGHVTGYQLEDGTVLDKPDAVELAKQGGITGVGISNRNGNEYLKSLPDDTESNNLSSLPSITVE
jgi:hypothetical protein